MTPLFSLVAAALLPWGYDAFVVVPPTAAVSARGGRVSELQAKAPSVDEVQQRQDARAALLDSGGVEKLMSMLNKLRGSDTEVGVEPAAPAPAPPAPKQAAPVEAVAAAPPAEAVPAPMKEAAAPVAAAAATPVAPAAPAPPQQQKKQRKKKGKKAAAAPAAAAEDAAPKAAAKSDPEPSA
eukprot:g6747.t2